MIELTQAEVERRIAGLDVETSKRTVCALAGHSRIQTTCFGYYYCGRCGTQVGDSLGSIYPQAESVVIVGHDCDVCRKNAEALTWKDTLMGPDPFPATTSPDEVVS